MAKTFSVTNPDALANAIKGLESALSENTIRKAAAAGVTVFKDEVALRAPRVSGDLAAGLTVTFLPEESVTGHLATYKVLFVGDTKPKGPKEEKVSRRALAGWLENGTSKMAPRPFVRPAFEAVKGAAVEASNAVITAALAAKG